MQYHIRLSRAEKRRIKTLRLIAKHKQTASIWEQAQQSILTIRTHRANNIAKWNPIHSRWCHAKEHPSFGRLAAEHNLKVALRGQA